MVDDGVDDGVAHLGRRLRVDDLGRGRERDLDATRDDRDPRTPRQRRLRDRDAHPAGAAVADEPDGVDGLGGPARAHDDVAALEVRVAGLGHHGRASGRIRRPHRPLADRPDHRVDDVPELRQPPDARLPRRQLPGRRRHEPVPEVPRQPFDVVARRPVRPHVPVHRRRDHDRGGGREARRGDRVGRDPVRHGPQPARRRGGHDDRIGRVGDHDVPDPLVREQPQDVGLDGVPRRAPRT